MTNGTKAMRLEPLQSALIGSQTPMLLTLMGAVGLLASLALGRVMTRFLYQIQPTDAASYAGASLSLAAVAFVASAWSATRATRIDPVLALRGE